MTIPVDIAELSLATDGVSKVFALTGEDGALYFMQGADLVAWYVAADGSVTELHYNTDFSVTGDGMAGAGSLTTLATAAYADGGAIKVLRATPDTQPENYEEDDGFPAATHNRAIDRRTLVDQDTMARVRRALTGPLYEDPPGEIPGLAARKNGGAGAILVTNGATGAIEKSSKTRAQLETYLEDAEVLHDDRVEADAAAALAVASSATVTGSALFYGPVSAFKAAPTGAEANGERCLVSATPTPGGVFDPFSDGRYANAIAQKIAGAWVFASPLSGLRLRVGYEEYLYADGAWRDVGNDYTAATLAAAQALFSSGVDLPDGTALKVACKATAADGYGGTFYYKKADTTSTFLQSALGIVDDQGRRFFRERGPVLYGPHFGIFPDGSDVTDKVQSIMDELKNAGGGYVFTKPGNYVMGGSALYTGNFGQFMLKGAVFQGQALSVPALDFGDPLNPARHLTIIGLNATNVGGTAAPVRVRDMLNSNLQDWETTPPDGYNGFDFGGGCYLSFLNGFRIQNNSARGMRKGISVQTTASGTLPNSTQFNNIWCTGGGSRNAALWSTGETVQAGWIRYNTPANEPTSGLCLLALNNGTTGGGEPTCPGAELGTVTDNGVTWAAIFNAGLFGNDSAWGSDTRVTGSYMQQLTVGRYLGTSNANAVDDCVTYDNCVRGVYSRGNKHSIIRPMASNGANLARSMGSNSIIEVVTGPADPSGYYAEVYGTGSVIRATGIAHGKLYAAPGTFSKIVTQYGTNQEVLHLAAGLTLTSSYRASKFDNSLATGDITNPLPASATLEEGDFFIFYGCNAHLFKATAQGTDQIYGSSAPNKSAIIQAAGSYMKVQLVDKANGKWIASGNGITYT